MEKNNIIEAIRTLVSKMGIEVKDIQVTSIAGQTLFTINTSESGALIGAGGETLHALNHIVKKLFESTSREEEPFRFVVDVNGYHLKHLQMLEAQARDLAKRVVTFKHDVEMSPMSAYDRLIVHASLQSIPDIKTGSEGEGEIRHVVIHYTGGTDTQAPA